MRIIQLNGVERGEKLKAGAMLGFDLTQTVLKRIHQNRDDGGAEQKEHQEVQTYKSFVKCVRGSGGPGLFRYAHKSDK